MTSKSKVGEKELILEYIDDEHIFDSRLKGKKCAEHGCGIVWYDSKQKELRYWKVCAKYHHAFNNDFQYSSLLPLKIA